jgi:hypothetical protein
VPFMETMMSQINQLTTAEGIQNFNPDNWASGQKISDRIRNNLPAEFEIDPEQVEVWASLLDEMPVAIHDVLREVIRGAIPRGKGITMLWRPGYDWKIEVTESPDTASSAGRIGVVLESRYPADPHPVQQSSAS